MSIKICLDAGHYGNYNRSPGVPAYYESRMNWKLHLLLKAELERYGFTVITTRSDPEKDLDLKSRGMASKGCDLFLSLHSNAVGSYMKESVDYVVLHRIVDDDRTDIDEEAEAVAKVLGPVIAETMGTTQPWRVNTRLSENDRDGDGKVNDNYYGVLNGARQAGTPGIIIEHSFHTCTRSVEWLLKDENLEKLAQAEAAALAQYYGMTKALPFVDVPEGAYYADAVRWAVHKGITKGTDETHFSPDKPCTRAQIVTMLYRALGVKG